MKLGKTLYIWDRSAWRNWLAKNFDKENEIWLIFSKKSSGNPRIIAYNDAVEEALCFGWIDSTVKKIDDENNAQRFSPRNPKSPFSQANKERLIWLAKEKKLYPAIQDQAEKVLKEKFIFPPDIIKAIRSDKEAWKN